MLRIAKLTDYGLVVLAHVARVDDVVSTVGLAERSGLPQTTVAKVAKALTRAGLLSSTRGLNGGYALARPAVDIRVAQVIEAIEGPLALTACSTGDSECADEHHCPLSGHWPTINAAVRGALMDVSLADLMVRTVRTPIVQTMGG